MNKQARELVSVVRLFLCLQAVLLVGACASFSSEQGVENSWRDLPESALSPGVTTQADVAELLGPPSQIISLATGPAFYYLREQRRGQGFILILYNRVTQQTRYDRAVFFFDGRGVLTSYAIRDDIARE